MGRILKILVLALVFASFIGIVSADEIVSMSFMDEETSCDGAPNPSTYGLSFTYNNSNVDYIYAQKSPNSVVSGCLISEDGTTVFNNMKYSFSGNYCNATDLIVNLTVGNKYYLVSNHTTRCYDNNGEVFPTLSSALSVNTSWAYDVDDTNAYYLWYNWDIGLINVGDPLEVNITFPVESNSIYPIQDYNNQIYVNASVNDSAYICELNDSRFNTGAIDNATFYNNTPILDLTCSVRLNCTNDDGNSGSDNVIFYTSGGLDNCSEYTTPLFNWSYYSSPGVTSIADSLLNLTCTDSTGTIVNSTIGFYNYNTESTQLCGFPSAINLSCDGTIYYTSYWTYGWLYEYEILNQNYNSDVTFINLTIPKLYLNFSENTDIQLITTDGVTFLEDTQILIAMSNISEGKVTVKFNNGTQFFEYNNDLNTFINKNLKVLDNQDDYLTVRVQDNAYSVLSNAITEVYEIDTGLNESNLVNTIYQNNEKSLYLNSDTQYMFRSYLSGYEQENGLEVVVPSEKSGEDLVISMLLNSSFVDTYVKKNFGDYISFDNLGISTYAMTLTVINKEMSDVDIVWYVNGTEDDTSSRNSVLEHSMSNVFEKGHNIHTINISIDGAWYATYNVREKEPTLVYESSFYQTLLYSKIAFIVFFIVTIIISLMIHEKHRNYGIPAALVLSILFSFVNLYMLVLAIPLGLGLIAKRVNGDDL